MLANDLIIDGLERVKSSLLAVVTGLSDGQLAWRPSETANSIAWLAWHLTRVIDDHVSELAGKDQVWGGWKSKFDFDVGYDTGYGFTSEQVATIRADAKLLLGYHEAVHDMAVKFVSQLTQEDYEKVVDVGWKPPVTLAVRLVSVVNDATQHVGQAAYVRGLLA